MSLGSGLDTWPLCIVTAGTLHCASYQALAARRCPYPARMAGKVLEPMQADKRKPISLKSLGQQALAYTSSASRVLLVGAQELCLPSSQRARINCIDLRDDARRDQVADNTFLFPFADAYFDFVCAAHATAADEKMFLEFCRVLQDGGTLCIATPCNPQFYRMPDDILSVYPDTAHALAGAARERGDEMALIESFVTQCGGDSHDTLVAVFGKGRIATRLPEVPLHCSVEARHIWTMEAQTFAGPVSSLFELEGLRAVPNGSLVEEIDYMNGLAGTISASSELMPDDIQELKNRLATLESTLRQREEEIEQARRELAQERANMDAVRRDSQIFQGERDTAREELAQRIKELGILARISANGWRERDAAREELAQRIKELGILTRISADGARKLAKVKSELQSAKAETETRLREIARFRELLGAAEAGREDGARELAKVRSELQSARAETKTRFREIVRFGELLDEAEAGRENAIEQREWLAQIYNILARRPWWWSLMPRRWRRTREQTLLREKSLFDARGYARLYPDVTSEGIDPLRHYIMHGMSEGRMLVVRCVS